MAETTLPKVSFAITLASISVIAPLAIHLFFPAIPVIKEELQLSESAAQLAFSVSLFTMGVATLAYGSLSDRFGRRPVLLSGLCLFLVGSLVCALADSLTFLVAGRLIQAMGAGCGVTLVRTIARDAYGQEHLVKAIAYLTMFYTMGPMLAPLVGGLLIDTLGWRWIFVFALSCGALVMAAAATFIYETHPGRSPGAAPLNTMQGYAILLSNLRFNSYVLQTGMSTASFLVMAAAAAVFMHEMLRRPAAEFGLYFLAFPFGFLSGNFITSRISDRFHRDTMVLAGSIISAMTLVIQSTILLAGYITPLSLCLPGFFISFAQGISMPSGQAGALSISPRHAGTAAGIGVFMQNVVGGFGVQIYGLIADGTVVPFVIIVAITGVATIIFGTIPFLLPEPKPDTGSQPARTG
ncbi:MAG: multidrug effflux MFS transporter [Hyphomicrobiaceae bacterium]